MQRVFLLAFAATALHGCSGDITAEPLTSYDLTDRNVVNSVLTKLAPQQRGPFLSFTIHHLASSKAFCGEVLIEKQGRQPSTIGDAIRLTMAREEALKSKPKVVDPATLGPVDRYHYELGVLEKEMGSLIDRREDMLMINPDAEASAQYKDLEARIASSAKEIAALRASAPPGAMLP